MFIGKKMNSMAENQLGYEKVSTLLRRFALPSITSTLVSSLYNIVDQIFIGQGVGYLGNAATNVSYPFSTICLAISLLVGIGSASRFSLLLGQKDPEKAAKVAGNGIVLMAAVGVLYAVLGKLRWSHCFRYSVRPQMCYHTPASMRGSRSWKCRSLSSQMA